MKQQQAQASDLKDRVTALELGQAQFNGGIIANDTEFQGQTVFDVLTTFKGQTVFTGGATFNGNVTINGDVTVNENGAGHATVKSGTSSVDVVFTKPLATIPVVTVSPQDFIDGQYKMTKITKDGFSIITSQPQSTDVIFNWTSIQKQ
jgi:hypothetical protein